MLRAGHQGPLAVAQPRGEGLLGVGHHGVVVFGGEQPHRDVDALHRAGGQYGLRRPNRLPSPAVGGAVVLEFGGPDPQGVVPFESLPACGAGGFKILSPGVGSRKQHALLVSAQPFGRGTHQFPRHRGQPAQVWGDHRRAQRRLFEHAGVVFQEQRRNRAAHAVGKQQPGPGHGLQHRVAHGFQVVHVFHKPVHVGQGDVRDRRVAPGAPVPPLVVGNHAVAAPQQRMDQFCVLVGVLGEAVDDHHRAPGRFSVKPAAKQRSSIFSLHGGVRPPRRQPGQHDLIHRLRIMPGQNQPIGIEARITHGRHFQFLIPHF